MLHVVSMISSRYLREDTMRSCHQSRYVIDDLVTITASFDEHGHIGNSNMKIADNENCLCNVPAVVLYLSQVDIEGTSKRTRRRRL